MSTSGTCAVTAAVLFFFGGSFPDGWSFFSFKSSTVEFLDDAVALNNEDIALKSNGWYSLCLF